MRRMYSEQELTKIIKEVSEAYISELIEDGEFDDDIASYVDAYLVEHPVDITALEGQTIAPANINATGNITGASIIENMNGYSFEKASSSVMTYEYYYAGACKNGNKLTLVIFTKLVLDEQWDAGGFRSLGIFTLNGSVYSSLIATNVSGVDMVNFSQEDLFPSVAGTQNPIKLNSFYQKLGSNQLREAVYPVSNVAAGTYYIRTEYTFLLSENLAD